MVNTTYRKDTFMNYTNYAHPFFAIDLTRNFEIDTDELRFFVSAMQGWKYVELEGIALDGTYVDTMLLWFYESGKPAHCIYDAYTLADFLDMAGFDISPNDISVNCIHSAFACECCSHAPLFLLEEMAHVKCIYGNVSNPNLYVQIVMGKSHVAKA